MTVGELKAILDTCNDDAIVLISEEQGGVSDIHDSQIFQTADGMQVIMDPSYGDERS